MQILRHNEESAGKHSTLVRGVVYQSFRDISRAHDGRPFLPIGQEQGWRYWSTVLGFVGLEALLNDK